MKSIRILASVLVLVAFLSNSARSQTFSQFCFGDGSSATGPCPCGNISPPATGGCLNSLGMPGVLVGSSPSGFARVAADISGLDRVSLTGTGMPNSFCIYFQGSANPPVLFGDGVRCVNNPFQVQLGLRLNAGGTSFVGGAPGSGDLVAGFPAHAPAGAVHACLPVLVLQWSELLHAGDVQHDECGEHQLDALIMEGQSLHSRLRYARLTARK